MRQGSKIHHRHSTRMYSVLRVHDDGTLTARRDDGRVRHIQRPEHYREVPNEHLSDVEDNESVGDPSQA